MASIALVHHHIVGRLTGYSLNLLDRTAECVPVVRIAMQGLDADDPVALARGRYARLTAKFVTPICFTLADAFHFGSMHAVELVLAGPCLFQQTLGQGEQLA